MWLYSRDIVITGDINTDIIKQNDNICLEYNEIITKYEYKNFIENPTRNGKTLIDHTITNRSSHRRCSVRKDVLRNFEKSTENTCTRVSADLQLY